MTAKPLKGDRSAWDSINYPEYHANDLENGTPIQHLPVNPAVGNIPRWDGSKWVNSVDTGGSSGSSGGDMYRATYDPDLDGKVETADHSDTSGSTPWAGVTGKPATYPPDSHTHDDRYYTETEQQTSGQSQLHWDNLTNKRSFKLDDMDAPDDNTDLNSGSGKHGLLPKLSGSATQYLNGQGGWSTPTGGSSGGDMYKSTYDPDLDNKVENADAADSVPWSGITSKPTTFTPSAHHLTHESSGSDAIKLDDLATPDDNTDLDASTTKHGLLKKLDGSTLHYLRGDGSWSTPASGSGGGSGRFDALYHADDEPLLTDYAWVNQGAATAGSLGGGIFLYGPEGSSVNYRVLVKSLPSTPWSVEIGMESYLYNVNYARAGICLRQSSNGRLVGWGLQNENNQLGIWQLISATQWQGGVAQDSFFPAGRRIWLKFYDNGTTRYYYWSLDGYNWIQYYSEGNTEWVTADQFGFIVGSEHGSLPAAAKYFHVRVY